MKQINISFKELVDYIRDKDLEIEKLRFSGLERNKKIRELEQVLAKLRDYILTNNVIYREDIVNLLDKVKE